MRVEFNGAVLVIDGFQGSLALTVEGKTFEFNPATESKTVSPVVEDKTYTYKLVFKPCVEWQSKESKNLAIETVHRETNCRFKDAARSIVDGWVVCIVGPYWETSNFKRELDRVCPDTYSTEPCDQLKVNVLKFT